MTNGLEIHCLRLFSIKSLFNGYMWRLDVSIKQKMKLIYWINIKGIDMTSPHKRGKCVSIKFEIRHMHKYIPWICLTGRNLASVMSLNFTKI